MLYMYIETYLTCHQCVVFFFLEKCINSYRIGQGAVPYPLKHFETEFKDVSIEISRVMLPFSCTWCKILQRSENILKVLVTSFTFSLSNE